MQVRINVKHTREYSEVIDSREYLDNYQLTSEKEWLDFMKANPEELLNFLDSTDMQYTNSVSHSITPIK